eukprot:CAMPEP_0177698514 /NCGR_PEP_ID=MMETSP0484_2-20121128/5084_1 /TAXON_ID=354590 /ORGANISM="Rhodomonas lens, Strain RHODO" /LENGTH=366 /DNA_ID=CAMNT_0019209617 /DNA_START=59 /DNA_END=1155 /DNA_ORIENTATION=-
MPRHDIAATGSNLLVLIAFCVMIMWFVRLCRTFYRLYRLNIAVATGQVVRLQTSDLQADERSMLFGEMEMLWRTNLQQQLLRARHIPSAVDVSELKVPFFIDKSSIEVQQDATTEKVGVNFRFRMTQRMAIQVYWQVKSSALRDLLSKVNKEHLGIGGNVQTAGHKKKRFFGQRYMSVNREGSALDQEAAGSGRSFEMTTRQSLEEGTAGSGLRSQAPIFAEDACAARSGVVALTDGGCETWVVFDNPDQCKVPLHAHTSFLPPAPPAPRPSTELRTPAALDNDDDAGGAGGAGGAAGTGAGDLVVEDMTEAELNGALPPSSSTAAATAAAQPAPDADTDQRYTVVIVAKALQEDGGRGIGALEPG